MSVNEKMTAIANAIRGYTGSEGLMGLDAMATNIEVVHSFGYGDGIDDGIILGRQEGYAQGFAEGQASKLFEVHKITIAEDNAGSSQVATKWIEDNNFVRNNCEKPGFMVQLISLQPHPADYSLCYAYNGNRQMMALGENLVCGFRFSRTSSNSTNTALATGNCITGNTQGVPYVKKEEGTVLSLHKYGNTALKSGDYLLIISVAEVEE